MRWWQAIRSQSGVSSDAETGDRAAEAIEEAVDAEGAADGSSMRRLMVLLRPYTVRLLVILLFLLALAGVNMVLPVFMKLLIDDVFPNRAWPLLWFILVGMLLTYLARNTLYFYSKYGAVKIGEDVCFHLRNRLFERLQQQSLRSYRSNKPGQLSSRVMNDSYVVQQFIQDDLPSVLMAGFMFTALVAALYAINWPLALASTVVLPLHLITFYWFKRPMKAASKTAQEQIAVVHGNLIERILGAEVVKGFTAEQRENEIFQEAIDRSRESETLSKRYHVTQKIVADLLVGLGVLSLLGFGAYQVMKPVDAMGAGTFIAFFAYVKLLYPTVLELMSGFAKLTKSTASIDRVFDMLATDDLEQSATNAKRPEVTGRVTFEDVTFRHDEHGEPALSGIDFSVEPGQVCAIVGPSGSGKSTLVSLVPRFIEPASGCVRVDGTDVRELELHALRRAIGIAFQECFLFNSTILENLRYAKPGASMDEIKEVARRTGAHQFICKLPQGYRTKIGEGRDAINLSRGEKQRITLMRAMLKNPKILILDEATASIDAKSASQIIPAILEFMKGKTTLMITHQPELLRHADTVVRLEDGKVAYQGPPPVVASTEDAQLVAGMRVPLLRFTDYKDGDKPGNEGQGGAGRVATVMLMALTMFLAALPGRMAFAVEPADNEQPTPPSETAETAEPQIPEVPDVAEPGAKSKPVSPAQSRGKFIAQPGLSTVEMAEVIDVAVAKANIELGYGRAGAEVLAQMPDPPVEMAGLVTLARQTDDGVRVLQIAYKPFRSQPVHVWLSGVTLTNDGGRQRNSDLGTLASLVAGARQTLATRKKDMKVGDLAAKPITLSYTDADRAVGVLKTLGYQAIEFKEAGKGVGKAALIEPNKQVDMNTLPAVLSMPGADATDLVGGTGAQGGSFGLVMTPSIASDIPNHTAADHAMQLMVLYDPAKPEQYSDLLDKVRRIIDVPAKQILIEAMVLEISETGLDKLGVEWELQSPQGNLEALKLGRLPTFNSRNDEGSTLDIEISDVFGEFSVKIEALIREGEATILSRPSVLTIDHRQASIRVGEDIPVATSASGLRGGDRITFDFKYIPVGILLNVRPRVSADADEISMQVDGIVSAEVPNQELVITDANGDELASAPRIATRRVQTYTRIANNTPFIIGGLVSKLTISQEDKVPLLGDIPILGRAFKRSSVDDTRREVIIVLTPYVLAENPLVGRFLPKDEEKFDSTNNALFRDAYRIRSEDVFDLAFLEENRTLVNLSLLANEAIRKNDDLASVYPFSEFRGNHMPGEEILVYRQMYEVIKRLGTDKKINPQRLIFFHPDESSSSGFRVQFLWPFIAEHAGVEDVDAVDSANRLMAGLKDKAIALTYTQEKASGIDEILSGPVPHVRVVDCPDRRQWSRLLWEMNQRDAEGNPRHTILIHNADDIERLRRAVVLKRVAHLNANRRTLTLGNFSVGRLLLMPDYKPDKVNLIDGDIAKLFFYTEQYYPALQMEMSRAMSDLIQALKTPTLRALLDNPAMLEDVEP